MKCLYEHVFSKGSLFCCSFYEQKISFSCACKGCESYSRLFALTGGASNLAHAPDKVAHVTYLTALNLLPLSAKWDNGHFTGRL